MDNDNVRAWIFVLLQVFSRLMPPGLPPAATGGLTGALVTSFLQQVSDPRWDPHYCSWLQPTEVISWPSLILGILLGLILAQLLDLLVLARQWAHLHLRQRAWSFANSDSVRQRLGWAARPCWTRCDCFAVIWRIFPLESWLWRLLLHVQLRTSLFILLRLWLAILRSLLCILLLLDFPHLRHRLLGLQCLHCPRGLLRPITRTLRGVLWPWRWVSFCAVHWTANIEAHLDVASLLCPRASTCWLVTSTVWPTTQLLSTGPLLHWGLLWKIATRSAETVCLLASPLCGKPRLQLRRLAWGGPPISDGWRRYRRWRGSCRPLKTAALLHSGSWRSPDCWP